MKYVKAGLCIKQMYGTIDLYLSLNIQTIKDNLCYGLNAGGTLQRF